MKINKSPGFVWPNMNSKTGVAARSKGVKSDHGESRHSWKSSAENRKTRCASPALAA